MTRKKLLIVLVALMGFTGYVSGKTISTIDLKISAGQTREFFVYMNTKYTNIVSLQLDMTLPAGLSLQTSYCDVASTVPDQTQNLYVGEVGTRVFRMVTTSFNLIPFATGQHTVLKLAITADNTFKGGTVKLSNMFGVLSSGVKYSLIDDTFTVTAVDYVKGDVNYDGEVNLLDITTTVDYILDNKRLYSSSMDIDGDGNVTISDAMTLIDVILSK